MIIVEEAGDSNGLAEQTKYDEFIQLLFFTIDPFKKSEKEKSFQVILDGG